MTLRWKMVRGLVAGLAALSVTFGTASMASAEAAGQGTPERSTPAVETKGLIPENDTLHAGIMEVFEAQLAQGKVVYSVDSRGNHLYQTDVNLRNGQTVQFFYEAVPSSMQAKSLSRASLVSGTFRAGGNEWYPKIWAGNDSKGRWVRFNRSAQGLMIGAGGTALKIAICAIPGVNAVGCAAVWGATIVAKQVIKRVGRCSTSRPWLYAYPSNIKASNCRS